MKNNIETPKTVSRNAWLKVITVWIIFITWLILLFTLTTSCTVNPSTDDQVIVSNYNNLGPIV